MFRLTKTFAFEASHQLPYHAGRCRNLHGHSWKCSLVVEGDRLVEDGPSAGMLMDFGDLGRVTRGLHDRLDHTHLNDMRLAAVVIEETCTSRCEYIPTS